MMTPQEHLEGARDYAIQEDVLSLRIENKALREVITELKAQIEKMKRCNMCKYSTRLGYCKIRQHNGVCENHDKWEIKEDEL